MAIVLCHYAQTTGRDWAQAGAVVGAALVHVWLSGRAERHRRALSADRSTPHVDVSGLWNFGAALALPPALALGVLAVVRTAKWRCTPTPPHQALFSTAAIAAAQLGAIAVLQTADHSLRSGSEPTVSHEIASALVLMLAAGVYGVIEAVLVGGVIALAKHTSLFSSAALGGRETNIIAVLTLAGGVVAGIAMCSPTGLLAPGLTLALAFAGDRQLARQRDLEVTAGIDDLTQLSRRNYWMTQAVDRLMRTATDGGSVGVVVIDLDYFKTINDTAGHPMGDAVLSSVASALREETRPGDVLGRPGGDEFTVLADNVDETELARCAERLRAAIASVEVVGDGMVVRGADLPAPERQDVLRVSASIGVAHSRTLRTAVCLGRGQRRRAQEAIQELIATADKQAIVSKTTGRNRVTTASELGS
ncbi:GGDEF domain-containing protein [Allokutzneria multivorans]|uniref:GGDEF domain-containing protein n=1 Tax=Allokutzneria multivorans TaxID=1142134 RepID=UPI0031EE8855